MEKSKILIITAILSIVLIFMISVFFSSIFLSSGIVPPVIRTPYGFVIMNAAIPDTPLDVPMYRGILREGDRVDVIITSNKSGQPLISSAEASKVAESLLTNYGGLPSDAGSPTSSTNYVELINGTSGEIIEKNPENTMVCFYRNINGIPVVGYSDRIAVDFWARGDIWINKKWRTLEYAGTNSTIIPPEKALIKLSRGEILDRPMCCLYVFSVEKISLGYYEKYPSFDNPVGFDDPVIVYEPVWIMSGSLLDGDPWSITVPAREGSTLEIPPGSSISRTNLAAVNQS